MRKMSALDLRRYNYEHHYGFQRTDCAPPVFQPGTLTTSTTSNGCSNKTANNSNMINGASSGPTMNGMVLTNNNAGSIGRIYNEGTDTLARQLRRPIPIRHVEQDTTPPPTTQHRCTCSHDTAVAMPRILSNNYSTGISLATRPFNQQQHEHHTQQQLHFDQYTSSGTRSMTELSTTPSGQSLRDAASSSESSAGTRYRHKNFENQRQVNAAVTGSAATGSGSGVGEINPSAIIPFNPTRTSNGPEQKYSASRLNIYDNNVNSTKLDEIVEDTDESPPLPPRPPLRPRSNFHQRNREVPHSSGVRKYVVWCLICGGTSLLLGLMFLVVYFMLRSYTTTVAYFETIPTFVPATLLILTGLSIISLARRRNRFSYLIKMSGAFGIGSALTCALVTITTTVIHMSRLQSLRECIFQEKIHTCTCYTHSVSTEENSLDATDDPAVRYIFDSTVDCDIVHGAMYSCLRAIFGLSVGGVLVAVFSCMLVYQLLSHERKKMYWEQLELRCRTLYSQPPPPSVSTVGTLLSTPRQNNCRCCEQCHAHRNMAQNFPWDPNSPFWIPGQATGNFYSPNPGDDLINVGNRSLRRTPGWSWPRMPWQRNDRFRATPSSPDSQYGFSAVTNVPDPSTLASVQSNYALINGPGYGIWGPPPPYSDPNSPARRGRYPFLNPMQCQQVMMPEQLQQHNGTAGMTQNVVLECHQRNSSTDTAEALVMQQQNQQQQQQQNHQIFRSSKRQSSKSKENHSDSDGAPRDKVSSTLPARKSKKSRHDNGAKSVGPNLHQRHPTAQEVFSRPQIAMDHEPYVQPNAPSCSTNQPTQPVVTQSRSRRVKLGVENTAFQPIEPSKKITLPEGGNDSKDSGESDVYYGDVSSCCNVSVQNDNNLDDSGNKQLHQESFSAEEVDDYLVQRFGKRDTSTRSRLPFPQIPEVYEQRAQPVQAQQQRDKSRYSVPKDQSRQSMCSVESGEKTDFTDLSPATPAANNGPTFHDVVTAPVTTTQSCYSDAFVASYPYSSNEQSQEAHKRLTKTIQDVFCDSESSPLTMINYDSDATNSYHHSSGSSINNLSCRSPKTSSSHSLTPAKRSQNVSNSSAVTSPGGSNKSGVGSNSSSSGRNREDGDRRL